MEHLRLGLKLFSHQLTQYRDEAIELLKTNKVSYIELFVFPGHLQYLNDWAEFQRQYNIDFTIHAPHSSQDVNLGLKDALEINKSAYKEVMDYKRATKAKYIVVHAGRDGDIEETVRQLNIIKPEDVMIENKPYLSPKKPEIISRGATIEEIEYVLSHFKCKGFCLDVGHAFCTAVSLKIDQWEYLKRFQQLKPSCYHLSDGEFNNPIDIHYHIGCGDYDWNHVFEIINTDKNITIETVKKNSVEPLENFKNDTELLRKFSNISVA